MNIVKNKISVLSSLLLATLVTGCGGVSSSSTSSTGSLSVAVTDAPIDEALNVVVRFTAVELKPQSGESFTLTFNEPKEIDLLAYQNGETAVLLENTELEAGQYNWMRLLVDANESSMDSYIILEDGGQQFSLYIPSGSNTGLKLNRPFIIAAGGATNFTIDFDLRKSVHNPGNSSDDYVLRPTLRIVDNTEVGTISGSIAATVVADPSCEEGKAIYLYNGLAVTPDDEGSATSPLTTAMPVYNAATDSFDYSISFVTAGDYTVALTCDAEEDDSVEDNTADEWSALSSVDATVSVNQTTEVNFE